jgi:hypothetical protein
MFLGFNKAKYTIGTNVPSPQVENTSDVKRKYKKTTTEGNNTSINVFRNNATTLKISKPGYQPRYLDIYPTNKRRENKLLDVTGGAAIVGAAILPSLTNAGSAGDELGMVFASVFVGFYGVFNIVTGLTAPSPGPAGNYAGFRNPKMEVKLYPDTVFNPGKVEIICDEFKTHIKNGTKVGNVYVYKKKYGPVTLNDSLYSFLSEINTHLSNINLLRSANTIEKSKSLFDKRIDPTYIIRGELKSENVDFHETSQLAMAGGTTIKTVICTKFNIKQKVNFIFLARNREDKNS